MAATVATAAAEAAATATVTTAVATAAAKAAATATVAAAAKAATAATILARLVETHGHERVNHLIEQGKKLLGLLLGEARNQVVALAALGLGALDGVLAGEHDNLAHVGLLRLNAGHDVLGLGVGHQGVELAQAHAQQVRHLLLVHLGLELEELQGTNQAGRLLLLLLGGTLEGNAATEQQVLGTLHLGEELLVLVLLLGLLGAIVRILGVLGLVGLSLDLDVLLDDLVLNALVGRLVQHLVALVQVLVLEIRHYVSFLRLPTRQTALPRHPCRIPQLLIIRVIRLDPFQGARHQMDSLGGARNNYPRAPIFIGNASLFRRLAKGSVPHGKLGCP